MNMVGGVVGGMIGGLLGAAIWAGISWGLNVEIGWVAWGIGGLVGFGANFGAKGTSPVLGILAVIITCLALVGGKYAAVHLAISSEVGSASQVIDEAIAELQNEELMISYMADGIVVERQMENKSINWPANVDPYEANTQADYPADIWKEADAQWQAKTPTEKEEYREELAEDITTNINQAFDDVAAESFMASFGIMDLIFFGLAIFTAFKMTSGAEMVE